MCTYTRVVESGFHGNRSLLAGRDAFNKYLPWSGDGPPAFHPRYKCAYSSPVPTRAVVVCARTPSRPCHRNSPATFPRRVVAALNHLSSPHLSLFSLLLHSALSLSPLRSFRHLPAATIHANRRWWSRRRWCGVAPRMRVLFHRCVASCSGEGEREASKGWQETEEKGGKGGGGGGRGGRSRGEERRRQRQWSVQVCTRANFEGGMREGGGTVIHRYAFQRRSFTTVGKWKEGKEDDAEKRAEKRVHEGSRGASTRRRRRGGRGRERGSGLVNDAGDSSSKC